MLCVQTVFIRGISPDLMRRWRSAPLAYTASHLGDYTFAALFKMEGFKKEINALSKAIGQKMRVRTAFSHDHPFHHSWTIISYSWESSSQ